MIVWGGQTNISPFATASGARYDPATDSWQSTRLNAATPSARYLHSAAWTGSQMIVWGGLDSFSRFGDGGVYDPLADKWTPTNPSGAPSARAFHSGIWTDDQMIVWGGLDASSQTLRTGGRYSVPSDSWTATGVGSSTPALTSHDAFWMGGRMLVFGIGSSAGATYCACLNAGTYFKDSDGDGVGDSSLTIQACGSAPAGYVSAGGDCDDANPSVWGTPGEALGLQFSSASDLSWSPPASMGGSAVRYDVLRSGVPNDFVAAATCLASDLPAPGTSDASIQPLASSFFYLVRAVNGCSQGDGPLGSGSDDVPRPGRTCP